jgi:hypothetical protein
MYYPSGDRRSLNAKIQAPFVMAEIRALRASIFKSSPEIQRALAIAEKVERSYDLGRADLFIPALETFCAIIEPFAQTILTGSLRRIGSEMFPQYSAIMGIAKANIKSALGFTTGGDVIRFICDSYGKCVVGPDAGTLSSEISGEVSGNLAVITDTTFLPCQLQIGVFLGAGKYTGLFNERPVVERSCRARGDSVCVYALSL